MKDLADRGLLKEAKAEIYKEMARLGGTITAEHGIGKIRMSELDLYMDGKSKELMQGIKRVFDPNGILNPGTAIR